MHAAGPVGLRHRADARPGRLGRVHTVQTATVGEAPPDKSALAARVWPNPARGAATLSVTTAAPGEVRYRVFDAVGRAVAAGALAVAPGTSEVALDLGAVAPGAYAVRVEQGGAVSVQRLTVVR